MDPLASPEIGSTSASVVRRQTGNLTFRSFASCTNLAFRTHIFASTFPWGRVWWENWSENRITVKGNRLRLQRRKKLFCNNEEQHEDIKEIRIVCKSLSSKGWGGGWQLGFTSIKFLASLPCFSFSEQVSGPLGASC